MRWASVSWQILFTNTVRKGGRGQSPEPLCGAAGYVNGAVSQNRSLSRPAMKHIHPATRTFQALRIFINQELHEIRALLEAAPGLLKPPHGSSLLAFIHWKIASQRQFPEGAQKGIWNVLTRKPSLRRKKRSTATRARAAPS